MFDTIVWATDGSELADSTLPLVTELARAHDSKIVAVHADELFGGGPVPAGEDELRVKISAQVEDLRNAGFETAALKLETGNRRGAAELIADAASEFQADLIVVGTRGPVLGSVASGLIRRAPCPVLAVPALHDRAGSAGQRRLVTA
jgi:nucleotide-binding universal stress UspA family protein